MNKSVETYSEFIEKIQKFFSSLKSQIEKDELTPGETVDLIAPLYGVQKEIDSFISEKKKGLNFHGQKEIRGERYKAKLTVSEQFEIPVEKALVEIAPANYPQVFRVVKKAFEVFVPKARVKDLQVKTGERESVSFDSL